ncbi:MAG: hypothetical protein ACOX2K_01225 [Bacillota bacterium]|jgi:O-antigen ligase
MFVITIGPLGKQWGRVLKVVAIAIALLLVALVAWKVFGSPAALEPDSTAGLGEDVATFSRSLGSNLWQRFLNGMEQWFRYGF